MRIATPSTSDTQISCARPLWCHLRPHHIGRPWLKATQLYMEMRISDINATQCSDVHLFFTPWALHINLLQQHQPLLLVMCVVLRCSRQKGLWHHFLSLVFEPHASVTEKINQTEQKGGSSGMQKRRAGLLWKIGNQPLAAQSERRLCCFRSHFSTMRVGCSSCPYPQLHWNVRDFHSKTLTRPWLMSGRMPLVTAEKDWTTYAALATSIPGLPVHGLLEERRDTTCFAFNKHQAQLAKQWQVASWLVDALPLEMDRKT